MTTLSFTLALIVAWFGLCCAATAWLILRVSTNWWAALLAFNAILIVTCWSVVEIATG